MDITRRGPFGNPYYIGKDGTREEVIAKCRRKQGIKIIGDSGFRQAVLGLRGSKLGCVCKPQPCHGDFLVEVCQLGVVDLTGNRQNPPIMEFQGEYRFLSNMWVGENPIILDGVAFPSSEHYYQAMKARHPEERDQVIDALTPVGAKKLGRKVAICPEWNTVRMTTMCFIVAEKFGQDEALGDRLLSTGDSLLIEGNYWHDNYWGRCTCSKCQSEIGLNQLGEVLMYVREFLPTHRKIFEGSVG